MNQPDFNIIQTERLLLREVNEDVRKYVMETYTDEQLKLFFGYVSDTELAEEKIRYEGGYTTFNKSIIYFQLIEKETGTVIGWCGYHTWYVKHRRAEIGYWLYDEKYRGKGYMREAMGPILDFGFQQMNLNRVEAFVSTTNMPSLAVLKKAGFTQEGFLREHYNHQDKLEDSLLFGLLKKEYIKTGSSS